MKTEKFTVEVHVDPQADLDAREVGQVIDSVLATHLDGHEGVAHATLTPVQPEGVVAERPLLVIVAMDYVGEFGTAEHVARQVEYDLEENYATDLPLANPRVLWASREMPDIQFA